MLMALASAQLDHAIIGVGLQSREFTELLAAVHAAAAAAPAKYHQRLRVLRQSRALQSLMDSGLPVVNFGAALDDAVAAGADHQRP